MTSAYRAEDGWGCPRAGPAAGVEAIARTEEQQDGLRSSTLPMLPAVEHLEFERDRLVPETLQRGDQVPHFEVTTLAGDVFSYSTIWQRKNLVLVTLPDADHEGDYPSTLAARAREFEERHAACVMTRDRVPGVPTPGAVVADRWGEIVYVMAATHASELPPASEVLEWLEYVEQRCPECEGEAK